MQELELICEISPSRSRLCVTVGLARQDPSLIRSDSYAFQINLGTEKTSRLSGTGCLWFRLSTKAIVCSDIMAGRVAKIFPVQRDPYLVAT